MKKLVGTMLLGLVILSACQKNILDIKPQDRIEEDKIFSDLVLVRTYHNELYNAIPHGFGIHMYSKYTDEAINTVPNGQPPEIFKNNSYNPDNIARVGNGDNNWMYYWNRGYQYIRKVNIFLSKMAAPDALSFSDKPRLIAEAKFVRAYAYFLLIERYGGVPIVDSVYNLGDKPVFKRKTFDECVAYIEKDLNEALPDLPEKYASSDANFGRATKDAVYGLRSRVLLYAASALFNPTHDNAKWQKAADAAAVFVNNADRGFVLYNDYRKLFNQPNPTHQNEYIFARMFISTNGHLAPGDNLGRRYGAFGGWWASNGPSQNLVDDYDMINGEPAFTWSGNTQTINPVSGYNPNRPYFNRDPRFDYTVTHDSSIYHGDFYEMWVDPSVNKWGFDSYKQSSDNPRGGYIIRKMMPEEGLINRQTTYTIPWPHIRLAEIYLNYAEAMFELGNEDKCREFINKVRARPSVGMPPIPATVTGEALRQRLYNERRIELAFEGHRFFDIRRWKIANVIENRPIRGIDIIKTLSTGATVYQPFVVLQKNTYQDKMNLLPVETAEVRRNDPSLQTPGW